MKFNKVQQIAIGLGIVVLASLLAYFVILKDKRASITYLQSENKKLEGDIRVAKAIKQQVAEIREEMEQLRSQLDLLKEILPTDVNKPKFMADVKRIANENGVEITKLSSNKEKADDVIVEHPFTYEAVGSYHDFGAFFAQLSDYPRIINVKGLRLERATGSSYTVKGIFLVSVYTYREPTPEELKAQLEEKRKARQGGGNASKKRGKR